MHLSRGILLAVTVLVAAQAARSVAAPTPARIDVELVTEAGVPPTAAQQWYQVLTDLKVSNLRVRSADNADQPAIISGGRPEAPSYKVVGIISRGGDLILPGGKFRTADQAQLGQWLARLRREGPDRARGGPRLPYGLTKEQFAQVYEDLSRLIPFSSKGVKPADFVHRLADLVRYPLSGEAGSAARLDRAEPIDVELRGMTAGTALAYTLDGLGLALVPRLDARRQPTYMITPMREKQERWPVGWPPRDPRRELVPTLFDNVDVELDDVELSRILTAVGDHVAAPILIDRAALRSEKIDLAKTKVSMPAKRSMYEIVLRKILVPHHLTHDVLLDEADKPFVWITSTRKAAEAKAKSKEPAR